MGHDLYLYSHDTLYVVRLFMQHLTSMLGGSYLLYLDGGGLCPFDFCFQVLRAYIHFGVPEI